MAIISKGACAILAVMHAGISFSHLKDPVESLKGFDVKGEISPIAAHCCAVIGSTGLPIVAMLLYAWMFS